MALAYIPCDFASRIIKPSWMQFALGFSVAIAHVPGWIGASVATSWFLLMIAMPFVIYNIRIDLTLKHVWGFIFLIYASLSLLWTYSFNVGLFFLLQMITLGMVFYYGSSLNNLTPIVKGLAAGLGISALISLFQVLGYDPVYMVKLPSGAPAGLFVNPNMFSEASAILLVALIVLKQWYWTIVTFPGIVFAHSRAGVLALFICGIIFVWNRSRAFALLIAPIIVLFIIGHYYNANFDLSSIRERFEIWGDTVRGLTLFGQGVGSYEIVLPSYTHFLDTVRVIPRYAHNDFLQLIFEFGIGTLFIIPLLMFRSNENIRYVLYAAGVVALFSFPLHVPMSAFIITLFAGFIHRANADDRNNGVCC